MCLGKFFTFNPENFTIDGINYNQLIIEKGIDGNLDIKGVPYDTNTNDILTIVDNTFTKIDLN